MSEETVYVGNAKWVKGQYGDQLYILISPDDKEKMMNCGEWINIVVAERKNTSKKGYTHYLKILPERKDYQQGQRSQQQESRPEPCDAADAPF